MEEVEWSAIREETWVNGKTEKLYDEFPWVLEIRQSGRSNNNETLVHILFHIAAHRVYNMVFSVVEYSLSSSHMTLLLVIYPFHASLPVLIVREKSEYDENEIPLHDKSIRRNSMEIQLKVHSALMSSLCSLTSIGSSPLCCINISQQSEQSTHKAWEKIVDYGKILRIPSSLNWIISSHYLHSYLRAIRVKKEQRGNKRFRRDWEERNEEGNLEFIAINDFGYYRKVTYTYTYGDDEGEINLIHLTTKGCSTNNHVDDTLFFWDG